MNDAVATIHLSLISHTNAGKTTLARTLLGRDIGEVRDAAHVTEVAEVYPLIESDGSRLMLWDTPGFGDTARLLKRLRHAGNPLGWILTQVWDRFRDRPFWCSQQAIRNARDHADVVLYLVNAAEDPDDAGYVAMEMQILTWIGKPVVLLLNQMGPPRSAAEESAEADTWRAHVKAFPVVRDVLPLDAFARCWVQEEALVATVGGVIAPDKRPAFERVATAWREKNLTRFHRAIELLASQLGRALVEREVLGTRTLRQQAREFIRSLGIAAGHEPTDKERAMVALAERLDADIRATTDALIALHELEGSAGAEVLRRMHADYTASEPLSEGRAAMWGGIASGALAGLKADLAAGGLTFGAGLVGGAIVGALGAAGLARGYNFVRGQEQAALRWSAEFIVGLTRSALLRYLAVAHFGRGRGDYVESEHPRFWQSAVAAAVEPHRDEIHAIWERSMAHMTHAQASSAIEGVIAAAAVSVLDALYPNQRALLQSSPVGAS